MNKLIAILLTICTFCSCANADEDKIVTTTTEPTLTDSLAPGTTSPTDSSTTPIEIQPAETATATKRAGEHPISLQWIGWDKPGKAKVTPAGNGWYHISGQQKTNDRNYLKIDGKIRRLGEKELEFEGTVETRIETIYGGEPCIKEGTQRFFGKGTRTYFRLQNMENCEGGNLVDYVDIYPGTSSL